MSDLCLGTVQFGMEYGIHNTVGQPSWEQSFEMLDIAIDKGIEMIDTARAYGEAELILGEYFKLRKNSDKVKVISKLRPNIIDRYNSTKKIILKECEETLRRLNVDYLNGYLLHTPEYIYNEEILEGLMELKTKSIVQNIGVSIYDIKEGIAAINSKIVDYIQLPYSVLDQRGSKTKFLSQAKSEGITVFARSAFLQGLFMMEKDEIPIHLHKALPYLDIFENLIKKYDVNKVSALIGFVKHEKEIDYLVFGVDNKEQLIEDIETFNEKEIPAALIDEIKVLINNIDKSIIFPSLWSNGKKSD